MSETDDAARWARRIVEDWWGRRAVGQQSLMLDEMKRPLKVGKLITYHGRPWRIGMVGMISGERYYWLVRAGGEVAMVPACLLEPR